jgi:hypothetical protein
MKNKTEEMQQYMGQVKGLRGLYVPPDPQRMQQAYQAGNVSLNPSGSVVYLVFMNYALPGEKMTLTFDPPANKFTGKILKVTIDVKPMGAGVRAEASKAGAEAAKKIEGAN